MGYFLEMDGMPVDDVPEDARLAWYGNEFFVKESDGTLRPTENFIEWQRRLTDEKPIHDNCYRHNVGGMNPCPWGDNA